MALIAKFGGGGAKDDDPKPKAGPHCASAEEIAEWATALFAGQSGVVELRSIGVSRHTTEAKHSESAMYAPDA